MTTKSKVLRFIHSLHIGKYAGQKIMLLGFLLGAAGAVIAFFGGFLQGISIQYLLIVLTAKMLMLLGWGAMIFGVTIMLYGIFIVWWKLFSSK